MPNLIKIGTVTVGVGGQSTIQFTGIPQTYQDLFIIANLRTSRSNFIDAASLYFNADTTAANYNLRRTWSTTSGTAVSTSSFNTYFEELAFISASTAPAGNFGTTYFYIGNYANTTMVKSVISRSGFSGTSSASASWGGLYWNQTAGISTITIVGIGGNFQQHSTATLYATSFQDAGQTGSKARGGVVTTSGGFTYHTFTSSGIFTPTTNITGAEALIVAGGGGGGGGGSWAAGGGGAGGLVYASSLTLNSGINYYALVGAGGAGGYSTERGGNGASSQFSSATIAVGGGGGGGYQGGGATAYAAQIGGSGGGGPSGQSFGGTESGAAGTAGQGNAGGLGYFNPVMAGGGGGGAGAAGQNATTTAAGDGGAGSSAYSAWGVATNTGHLVGSTRWYAGGGGGSCGGYQFGFASDAGQGGNGGGGFGGTSANSYGSQGLQNTGGGGGGRANNFITSGGSGVVIVRYTT